MNDQIPMAPPDGQEEAPPSQFDSAAEPSASNDSPINILIVDDEPKNLIVLETVLDDPSYRLVRAGSADQALLALIAEEFALLILDIRMPGMNGLELAQMIKDRKKTAMVPIIFLTAYYNDNHHVLEGYDAGAVDYLLKPVNPAVLRSKVGVFVALHRKNQEVEAANGALVSEVAERRRVEGTLRATVEELEIFSFSLAHDLRAPLRSVSLFAEILTVDHSSQLDDKARGYLERIGRAAGQMDRLIVDILSYSKFVHGELKMQPVDVRQLIDDIISTYPSLHAQIVDVSVEGELPLVLANEAALTQIVSNLLGNAVKFVAPGVRPRVVVRGEQKSGFVRLWFEDNGIGIPKTSHSRLFQLFSRIRRAERFEGTGIGLAVVRKAAERMNGTVGLESEEGQGSRFWVQLMNAGPVVGAPE